MNLDTSIQFLRGVGDKRAVLYRKLNIATIRDLLYHFPRDYVDLSAPFEVDTAPIMEMCAVRAFLISKSGEQRIRAGLSIFKLLVQDDGGTQLEVSMFNCKYTIESLVLDKQYIFYGKINNSFSKKQMSAPTIYPCDSEFPFLPIYPQTAGISSALMRKHIALALESVSDYRDIIPAEIIEKNQLLGLKQAIVAIHFPENIQQVVAARKRFVFEELLVLALTHARLKLASSVLPATAMNADLQPFYSLLPFTPTGAQLRSITEVARDLAMGHTTNRLVQGDVGSGKTLVAAAAVYIAYKSAVQSAVMVPTEILAEQHFATMNTLLKPLGVNIALLTGSVKAGQKREILQGLLSGEIHLCIGTHALLSDGVEFNNLSLVVTDEQHRFGVAQRAKLSDKSSGCHVVVMSATPIPRTLSLIIYGDLALSVIDELPPGRQKIETLLITSAKRERAMGFIRSAIDNGQQVYIVCPLIEVGEVDLGLMPVIDHHNALAENQLKGYNIGLLHGKMKSAEKELVMRGFKQGSISVLVTTTVIEVGVDVPNATIMLIENAERFGLSQLHQLRGRVGRGQEKSYCILLSDSRNEPTRERLKLMRDISDGFQLAQQDLKLRGPGDFFGNRQHGLPLLKAADLGDDIDIMENVGECAKEILASDSDLSQQCHKLLRQATERMLCATGANPN